MPTSTSLIKQSVHDRPAYTVRDKVLVQVDDETGKWNTVDHFDRDLDHDTLKQGYGLWQDKEVKQKHLLFFNQTTREADGEIQADEVATFSSRDKRETELTTWGETFGGWFLRDEKIVGTGNGRPTLQQDWRGTSHRLVND